MLGVQRTAAARVTRAYVILSRRAKTPVRFFFYLQRSGSVARVLHVLSIYRRHRRNVCPRGSFLFLFSPFGLHRYGEYITPVRTFEIYGVPPDPSETIFRL